MSHSFNRIWIHSIWSTKERIELINPSIEEKIYADIKKEFITAGCPVHVLNGMPDHVHCLFLLNPQRSVADIIKQVKGSVSHQVNQTNLVKEKFAWQTGYAAYSVSESAIDRVYQYIRNQKEHHKKMDFKQEYEKLLSLHSLQLNDPGKIVL